MPVNHGLASAGEPQLKQDGIPCAVVEKSSYSVVTARRKGAGYSMVERKSMEAISTLGRGLGQVIW